MDQRFETYGIDKVTSRGIDTALTWGPAMARWMERNAPGVRIQMVGKMMSRSFGGAVSRQTWPLRVSGSKVLLLQYAVPGLDTAWPQSGQYAFFVKVVRQLNAQGCEVKVKLHPGPYKPEHYREIARLFNLDCEIHRDGQFADFVRWSDLVIGPATSGAMVEVVALNKPFYPAILQPSTSDLGYMGDCAVYKSAEEVCVALAAEVVPDPAPYARQFAAADQPGDPAQRVWHAIHDACRG